MRTGKLRGFGLEFIILILIGIFIFLPVLFSGGCMSETEDSDNKAPAIPLEDQAPETEYTGRNNSAILKGVQVGTLSADNLELFKTLKFTLKTANKNFKFGPATISRSENTAGLTIRLLLRIKNATENKAFCGVKTNGLKFIIDEEEVMTDALDKQAIGSVGIENSSNTASCLAPSEVGYFFQKVKAVDTGFLSFYGDVDEMEIEKITVESISVINPNISLAPERYSIIMSDDSTTDSSASMQLTFEIKNDNVDPAYIWPNQSYYILMDNDGREIFWGVIDSFSILPIQLLAGESTDLESSDMLFTGNSSTIRVIVGFSNDAFSTAF